VKDKVLCLFHYWKAPFMLEFEVLIIIIVLAVLDFELSAL
jgi:hypothetical protein